MLVNIINTFATINALFVRTFLAVLSQPILGEAARQGKYLFSFLPFVTQPHLSTTFIALNHLNLMKSKSKSKKSRKLSFELTYEQLSQPIVEYKNNRKKIKRKSASWFHKRCRNNDLQTLLLTFVTSDLMGVKTVHYRKIDVSSVKRLNKKIDPNESATNMTLPAYQINARFTNNDDVIFQKIHEVRIFFHGHFSNKQSQNIYNDFNLNYMLPGVGNSFATHTDDSDSDSDDSSDSSDSSDDSDCHE